MGGKWQLSSPESGFLSLRWSYQSTTFGYTKWAFPTVELKENNDASIKHPCLLVAIVLALIAQTIWEIRR